MNQEKKLDYAAAGVSLEAADEAVARIKKLARSTFGPNVLSDIGSFGGLFQIPLGGIDEATLVASADGVGTKLKLAFMSGNHTTVGQDLVNHCVNDILVQGATPLFFMDYIGVGKLDTNVVADLVAGLATACRENGMALLGGETAEMPGFYADGEYDLVGFVVGLIDRKRIIIGADIKEGDTVIGLPSTGLHTNGFSLARKICFEISDLKFESVVDQIGGPIGTALMAVHKSYLSPVAALLKELRPSGMAHITGSGLPGNIIRIVPDGLRVIIDCSTWPHLSIFEFLQKAGKIADKDMYDAFNMGIGYVLTLRPYDLEKAEQILAAQNQPSYRIGQVVKGERGVELKY